jgi:hypothetical protein
MPQPQRKRRRRWPIVLAVLAILLGAGWIAAWNYAAGKVETTIAGWKEREARVGRIHNCVSQSIGGFPFRIEVRCEGAGAELRSNQPPVEVKAKNILVSAQIWRPTVLVSEFGGPLTVGEPGKAATVAANWRHAQSEVHGLPTAPERVVIALDQPVVDDTAQRKRLFQATRLDLEGRMLSGSARDNPVIEAVLKLIAASTPSAHPAAALPIDADITVVLTGLKDFSPKSWPDRFREIQQANGRIDITKARLRQGESLAVASGTLRLSPRGRLDGELRVTVANLEKLLPALGLGGAAPPPQAPGNQVGTALDRVSPGLGNVARRSAAPMLTMGLALLGQPTELEGQRAYVLPLRFNDGMISLGPLRLGETPPLY